MNYCNKGLYATILFAGSVFLTSGKFVNATKTPKFYFAVVSVLVATAIVTLSRKGIKLSVFRSKTTLWGVNLVCFLQASYGLIQFMDWIPANNSYFSTTGSFNNPAGFAAFLSMCFPIGLYLWAKAKKVEQYLAGTGLVVIVMVVFLSGSRTGIMAIIIPSFIFSLFQKNIIGKFQKLRYYNFILALGLAFILVGAFILYSQKKDSADGRLLIWKVSAEMIKNKPVWGHGYGAFQAKYMDYQAEYFKNNPDSKYAQLADNVKHPFNEFIKVAVEFGMTGLAIILSFVLFVLLKIVESKNENRGLVLSGLTSFLVFACFSYPLQYVVIWLLLVFYLSTLLPATNIKIRNTPITIITRGVIVIACLCVLFITHKQIRAEIKWKTIAVSSLRGHTEEMLPEYEKLYSTSLKRNPFFLYNYGAELNVASRFDKSINVMNECEKHFNDYDLQMLLADNYYKNGDPEKAIQIYEHASNMIPCRFLPLFHIFEIYKEKGRRDLAIKYANEIINKKVKIPSNSVSFMKSRATEYLSANT